ncbi:HAMP domain-containing histidine kinase [Rhodomicrobium sp. Az07]|uniref:sensor histidine kinase n=1 Tax=Rhodomicrobium sp. Az07 TaxID=2839034 RepID=UPI001BE544BE|nr:HAMP domain-containing sensor histidine kinase [Rhodomicrobium sp. Az07]MBT3071957.1 HAMP domain-containing histidine kinase [Rhodomicrobium sp. Az07]
MKTQRPKGQPLLARLRYLVRRLRGAYVEHHAVAAYKLPAAGMLAIITFPLYYVIWAYVFPQPYENLELRLAGCVLCLPIALRPHWPRLLISYYLTYCYWALLFIGPVFFTLMLLMNGVNSVWLMSVTVIILFTFLLYDLANGVFVSLLGALIGLIGYWLLSGTVDVPTEYLVVLPVYGFILCGVVFLSHSERLVARDKLVAARALASSIAHEMRTPLLGIRLDANRTSDHLKRLGAVNQWARERGCHDSMSDRELAALTGALERVDKHAVAANLVIDMLLTNLRQESYSQERMKLYAIAGTIDEAINRFQFRPGERELITVRVDENFTYRGIEVLMVHVIFNLVKNALRAVAMAEGQISIEARTTPVGHLLSISDTGRGFEPSMIPYIFVPFVTGHAETGGTGIGLSFCRRIIEGFDGSISCSSEPGRGTTFEIRLPIVEAKTLDAAGAASSLSSSGHAASATDWPAPRA